MEALGEGVARHYRMRAWRAYEQAPTARASPPALQVCCPAMEAVLGIGGLFFRARDPQALGLWYQRHLGIGLVPPDYTDPPWYQQAGPTVFAPFEQATQYFGDAAKQWMINFRVADLDAMMAQLTAAGIDVTADPQRYPNGRFARLHDPEGNPIELWQAEPPEAPAAM